MHGVIRGGHFSTGKALNVRSSGYRDAYSLRGNGSTQIGFRLWMVCLEVGIMRHYRYLIIGVYREI